MWPWIWSHAPPLRAAALELPSRTEYLSPQGVLLPQVYGTTASPLPLELRGPAAWPATPFWAVCRHAFHQMLPWLRVMFVMVPHAARPGSDQWLWSTAPAIGPVGWLGRSTVSNPGGVDRCVLSFCCPRCMCVSGVLAHLAPVHWCGPLCALRVLLVPVSPLLPPPNFPFIFPLYLFSLLLFFVFFCFEMEKGARAHCRHRHGRLVQRCSSVAFTGVRPLCFVRGRASEVRLARFDVHGCGPEWVWVVVSLPFGAGWSGGRVGCGCGLRLLCNLGGLG